MKLLVRSLTVGLFLTVLCLSSGQADARFTGMAELAAGNDNFPCSRFLDIVKRASNPAMSMLWGSFGNSTACVQRFVNHPEIASKPNLVEVYISNEVCRRNGDCESADLARQWGVNEFNRRLEARDPELESRIIRRMEAIKSAFAPIAAMPNTRVVLVPGLEDNFTKTAYRNFLKLIWASWPGVVIARNSNISGSAKYEAAHKEAHGDSGICSGSTDMWSEDGELQSTSDSRRFLVNGGQCFAQFLWRPAHQGAPDYPTRPSGPRKDRHFEIPLSDVQKLGDLLSRY